MMLHRHFSEDYVKAHTMTELEDVTPKQEEYVSEVFPPDEPKRRGRPKKTED